MYTMRTNSKYLMITLLLILLVSAIGGAALVMAADATSLVPAFEEGEKEGEDERPASASEARLTEAEAIAIAEAARSSTARYVELEREGGIVVYSIELEDGSEVELNADTGDIVEIELPGQDDD
jgi:uncharacterized membrane protein YkoI